ncbi:MAG: hypothetical protein WCE94_15350 [Candidatus Methanoperedens sp.]|jgi:hypothetical protein
MAREIELSNINGGKRNPKVRMSVSGQSIKYKDQPEWHSVFISLNTGIINNMGFHTRVEDAKALVKALNEAIEIAECPITETM